MSSFKPKRIAPPARPSPEQIMADISEVTSHLLSTTPPEPPAAPSVSQPPAPAVVPRLLMMNFKATPAFARMLAELAEAEGGLRKVVARLAKQAGYDVPEADLNPVHPRKRRFD